MADRFRGHTVIVQKLGADISGPMEIKYHGGIRNIQRRDISFCWQRLDLTAPEFRIIGKKLQDDRGAAIDLSLPAPGYFLAFRVLRAGEAEFSQIVFEGVIGVRVREHLHLDDDIDIAGSGMSRDIWRKRRVEMARGQTADQIHRVLPRAEPEEQRDKHALAVLRHKIVVSSVSSNLRSPPPPSAGVHPKGPGIFPGKGRLC